jgi:hypothetical protein
MTSSRRTFGVFSVHTLIVDRGADLHHWATTQWQMHGADRARTKANDR